MKLAELEALLEKATQGPWWSNGLDIESSHVIVAEGEKWVQLYNTETGQPSRRIKPHQRSHADDVGDDDIVILSCVSILGDRDLQEAQATADLIVSMRNSLPGLLAEIRAARELAKAVILFVNDPREVGIGRAAQYKMEFETLLEAYRKARAANEGEPNESR